MGGSMAFSGGDLRGSKPFAVCLPGLLQLKRMRNRHHDHGELKCEQQGKQARLWGALGQNREMLARAGLLTLQKASAGMGAVRRCYSPSADRAHASDSFRFVARCPPRHSGTHVRNTNRLRRLPRLPDRGRTDRRAPTSQPNRMVAARILDWYRIIQCQLSLCCLRAVCLSHASCWRWRVGMDR